MECSVMVEEAAAAARRVVAAAEEEEEEMRGKGSPLNSAHVAPRGGVGRRGAG